MAIAETIGFGRRDVARSVVMDAGIGGISQVDELKMALGKQHQVVLIGNFDRFKFTPSNPWIAVGWRREKQVALELPKLTKKCGIAFFGQGVWRVYPDDNRLELNDGSFIGNLSPG